MKNAVNFWGSKILVSLLFILLVGCASSPPSRFYLLSPLQNGSEVHRSTGTGAPCISLGIGPVRLPEYTNRPQIVTRTSQNELSRAQFDLWAEPLSNTFSRVIAENLTRLLCTESVHLFPWMTSIKPDYIVRAEVIELTGDLDTTAYLQVQWTLWGAGEGKELVQRRSTYSEPVQDRTYHGLVQAYSIMVGQLSHDIARAIEGL
jgi:uncharacterized lipoprotein YmbA